MKIAIRSSATRTALALLALAAVAGVCFAAKPKPLPPDPKFLAIENVVILPIIDARAGKKDNVNLDTVSKSAMSTLKSKNYVSSQSPTTGKTGDIAEEDLNEATPEWIKGLGPGESRWVLVIGIRDVHSKLGFGSTGNAEVFGFLFDKQDGSVLWKGTGVGQAGQGGLIGMAMKSGMSTAAIQTAVGNMLVGIPKVPKKRA